MKILVFGLNENPGGVEAFLLNYLRNLNLEKYQIDFLVNTLNKVAFEPELEELGCQVYHIPPRSQNPKDYYRQLDTFFKKHASEYNIFWMNVNSLANIDYLKYAKKYGIKNRIIHSHNSRNMDSFLRGLLHHYNKLSLKRYATHYWGCSREANKWFYDSKLLSESRVIPNAINVRQSEFNENSRKKIRQELGWQDKYILGNVGRLHFQKNQKFMLKVMKNLISKLPDARLVLVGQGEDEKELKQMVKDYHLDDVVYFAGVQNNVSDWLSAFDLFFFPSQFEGLSIAALEAEANGLQVLTSQGRVSEDVNVTGFVEFLPLDGGVDIWVDAIVALHDQKDRMDFNHVLESFTQKGYEISEATKNLEHLFDGIVI